MTVVPPGDETPPVAVSPPGVETPPPAGALLAVVDPPTAVVLPALVDPPVLAADPPEPPCLTPESPAELPPEQAIRPASMNNGSSERGRVVVMIILKLLQTAVGFPHTWGQGILSSDGKWRFPHSTAQRISLFQVIVVFEPAREGG